MMLKDNQSYVDECSATEDNRISNDEGKMVLIKQIGKDIHPSIQVEVDYPSKQQNGKLPILPKRRNETRRQEGHSGKEGGYCN